MSAGVRPERKDVTAFSEASTDSAANDNTPKASKKRQNLKPHYSNPQKRMRCDKSKHVALTRSVKLPKTETHAIALKTV